MALLEDSLSDDPALRKAMADVLLEKMHTSNLLIHMPIDGTPQSQACTEHVLSGIYGREELEQLAAFNKRKRRAATE